MFQSSHCVFQTNKLFVKLFSVYLSFYPEHISAPDWKLLESRKFKKKKKKIGLVTRGNPRASPLGGGILAPQESLKGWTAGRRRGRVGG